MNFRRRIRGIIRLTQFGIIAFTSIGDYWIHFAFRKNKATPAARAVWLQRHSRRTLRMFHLEPKVSGTIPTRGFIISNHLSYLDILTLSSITPAVFVAKKEVKSWPIIGICAQMGGTLFVDRTRKMNVGETTDEIQSSLDSGALVVLFPEGTSTNGKEVLPFRSALLEPAARRTHPIYVCFIEYTLGDGDAGNEICYWGDHTFFPHMLNLMSRQEIGVSVNFAPFNPGAGDRKEMALKMRAEVVKLKDELALAK